MTLSNKVTMDNSVVVGKCHHCTKDISELEMGLVLSSKMFHNNSICTEFAIKFYNSCYLNFPLQPNVKPSGKVLIIGTPYDVHKDN
jgi:hypothetical protein